MNINTNSVAELDPLSQKLAISHEQTSLSPNPTVVDITDHTTLIPYLIPKFQQYFLQAVEIATRIYEKRRELHGAPQYGNVLPPCPEILLLAMELAKGKTALEIGGASGEKSFLLALAGATKVYMNDITSGEIATFENSRSELPRPVQDVLESVEGNCLDLLDLRPELQNQVGLVLCDNVIHFFNDAQQEQFFRVLDGLLKPGGTAIFTVNSIYPYYEQNVRVLDENPEATSFKVNTCLLTNATLGLLPYKSIYQDLSVIPGSALTTESQATTLYTKNTKTGFKWSVDQEAFNRLDAVLRPKIKEACKQYHGDIKGIPAGIVQVLQTQARLYNPDTLRHLFESHGFEVTGDFATDRNGHLVNQRDLTAQGNTKQIGIIVKKK